MGYLPFRNQIVSIIRQLDNKRESVYNLEGFRERQRRKLLASTEPLPEER